VAYRTVGTPGLLDEVRRRAAQERCRFVLLALRPYWDPETEEAALTLELAVPLLEDAAGGQVEGRIGDADALVEVRETLEREPFDEVIARRYRHACRTGCAATCQCAWSSTASP
jgi:hypothetical protein